MPRSFELDRGRVSLDDPPEERMSSDSLLALYQLQDADAHRLVPLGDDMAVRRAAVLLGSSARFLITDTFMVHAKLEGGTPETAASRRLYGELLWDRKAATGEAVVGRYLGLLQSYASEPFPGRDALVNAQELLAPDVRLVCAMATMREHLSGSAAPVETLGRFDALYVPKDWDSLASSEASGVPYPETLAAYVLHSSLRMYADQPAP